MAQSRVYICYPAAGSDTREADPPQKCAPGAQRGISLRNGSNLEDRAEGRETLLHSSGCPPPVGVGPLVCGQNNRGLDSTGAISMLERLKSEALVFSLVFLANFSRCRSGGGASNASNSKHWRCGGFGGLTANGDRSPTHLKVNRNASHSCARARASSPLCTHLAWFRKCLL